MCLLDFSLWLVVLLEASQVVAEGSAFLLTAPVREDFIQELEFGLPVVRIRREPDTIELN